MTVTELTPAVLRDYVVHQRTMHGEHITLHVQATTMTRAQALTGLIPSRVHDTSVSDCPDCRLALSGGAVTR